MSVSTDATGRSRLRYRSGDHAGARRYFHVIAAAIMLLLMLAGFWPFYLGGKGMGGREIEASILALVAAHGVFMTAWVLTFGCQALLIATRKHRWHRAVGWWGAGIALGVTLSAYVVAIESARLTPDFRFWGMAYRQFLLIMLVEPTVFAALVGAGLLWRKRREVHRAMMLMATLSIMAGATVRMPVLIPVFGEAGLGGIFGPVFALGAVFLAVHSLLLKSVDRPMAGAFAFMVVAYTAATLFATSDAWSRMAASVFGA